MRFRFFLVALVPVFLHACSASEHKVVVVFPNQAMMEATSRISLAVVSTEDPGACEQLRREQAVAGSTSLSEESYVFPFGAGDAIGVGKLGEGHYAFVVTATNKDDQHERFLIGCTAARVSLDKGTTVRILLAEFRGCCGGGAGCLSESTIPCYDGLSTSQDVGVCVAGTASCTAGFFMACVGQVLPTDEVCNQKDDDCDGIVDEDVCGTPDGALDLGGDGMSDGTPDGAPDGMFDGMSPDGGSDLALDALPVDAL
ncbi:MAG: hypothetical protein KAI47_11515, partial [Deltaproteobacteria bacterium]|nr:hypothetical protein [Deltaproteobacteria bacterium]